MEDAGSEGGDAQDDLCYDEYMSAAGMCTAGAVVRDGELGVVTAGGYGYEFAKMLAWRTHPMVVAWVEGGCADNATVREFNPRMYDEMRGQNPVVQWVPLGPVELYQYDGLEDIRPIRKVLFATATGLHTKRITATAPCL
jgi:hypothetical protein